MRRPLLRFNEFMTHLRPVRTDVTRAEALMWKRNPLEGGSHRVLAEGRGRR